MRQAWRQGSEHLTQPIDKLVGSDGTVVLAQNALRHYLEPLEQEAETLANAA